MIPGMMGSPSYEMFIDHMKDEADKAEREARRCCICGRYAAKYRKRMKLYYCDNCWSGK